MSWHSDAQCAGDDLAKYVLDSGPHKVDNKLRDATAKRLCTGCPVMKECRDDAREYADFGVVRGGEWIAFQYDVHAPLSA